MNSKGLVGDGMTWILAFILIFFIVTIFSVVAVAVSKNDFKAVLKEDYKNTDIISINVLQALLKTSVDNPGLWNGDKTVAELLELWKSSYGQANEQDIKQAIETKVRNILDKTKTSDYRYLFFATYYSSNTNYIKIVIDDEGKGEDFIKNLQGINFKGIDVKLLIFEK